MILPSMDGQWIEIFCIWFKWKKKLDEHVTSHRNELNQVEISVRP